MPNNPTDKILYHAGKAGWNYCGRAQQSCDALHSCLLSRESKMVWVTVGRIEGGPEAAIISMHLPKGRAFKRSPEQFTLQLDGEWEAQLPLFLEHLDRCAYEVRRRM